MVQKLIVIVQKLIVMVQKLPKGRGDALKQKQKNGTFLLNSLCIRLADIKGLFVCEGPRLFVWWT